VIYISRLTKEPNPYSAHHLKPAFAGLFHFTCSQQLGAIRHSAPRRQIAREVLGGELVQIILPIARIITAKIA
jgi:hypothetical protein